MKKSNVKELLEKRKIAFTAKESKMGEMVYQCVIFRKIARITDNFSVILIEFPFGEFPLIRLSSVKELELYLDNGGK